MNAQIFDVLSQGTAFVNPLPALSSASQGLIASGKATTATIANAPDTQVQAALSAGGLTPTMLTSASTMFTTASAGITTLNNYGDQSINEAYSRIGTSVSYKSGLKSIGREPQDCGLINKAFGVIQETGRQWLSNMQSVLTTVTNKMNELADIVQQGVSAGLARIQALAAEVTQYVNTAISQVNAVIKDITDGIAAELAHIQGMVAQCLNFSFANVMAEWFKDGCAQGVINNIGSPELKNSMTDSTV